MAREMVSWWNNTGVPMNFKKGTNFSQSTGILSCQNDIPGNNCQSNLSKLSVGTALIFIVVELWSNVFPAKGVLVSS